MCEGFEGGIIRCRWLLCAGVCKVDPGYLWGKRGMVGGTMGELLILFLTLAFVIASLTVTPIATRTTNALGFRGSVTLVGNRRVKCMVVGSIESSGILKLGSDGADIMSMGGVPFLSSCALALGTGGAKASVVSFGMGEGGKGACSFGSGIAMRGCSGPLGIYGFKEGSCGGSFSGGAVIPITGNCSEGTGMYVATGGNCGVITVCCDRRKAKEREGVGGKDAIVLSKRRCLRVLCGGADGGCMSSMCLSKC